MRPRFSRSRLLGAALAVLLAPDAAGQPGATPGVARYRVDVIETLGGQHSEAFGINSQGQVVGVATDALERGRAILWQDGQLLDLGVLPGDEQSWAQSVNETGDVTVTSRSSTNHQMACLWSQGQLVPLGTLGGDQSGAFDIEGSVVVGWAMYQVGTTRFHGFSQSNGTMTDLGTHPLGLHSQATSIARGGIVAGTLDVLATQSGVYLRRPGEGMELLPGLNEPGMSSFINDLNSSGLAVGAAQPGERVFDPRFQLWIWTSHAVAWEDGVARDLGTLGGRNSSAIGVDERGRIVGAAEDASGELRAVLWQEGEIIDLQDRIPPDNGWEHLRAARDINDHGQIVGEGIFRGQTRGFVLTPMR